jgi:hypothetical protein
MPSGFRQHAVDLVARSLLGVLVGLDHRQTICSTGPEPPMAAPNMRHFRWPTENSRENDQPF